MQIQSRVSYIHGHIHTVTQFFWFRRKSKAIKEINYWSLKYNSFLPARTINIIDKSNEARNIHATLRVHEK